jgi:hypothetical protein
MVENTMAFFYPEDSASATQAPQLLDGLPTRSREVILANMIQSASLTLGILKSLYPRASLDEVGDGFVTTYTEEEASKLVDDSVVTMSEVEEMLPVDMQLK